MSKLSTLALITSSLLLSSIQAAELSQYLTTRIEPEPIKRVEPKYPIDAAREGREGWAVLSFVINKDGSVSNVIVKETSGSKDIAKASVNAVKQWQFKPAMENGKPVQQCVNTVEMNFRMKDYGTTAVSKRFKRKYHKAREALLAKDYKALNEQLDAMQNTRNMHMSESNFMHLLAAAYAQQVNDKHKQLYHLERVRNIGGEKDDEQYFTSQYHKFLLEVSLNRFPEAYSTFKQLEKLPAAEGKMAKLHELVAKMDAIIASEQDLPKRGNIEQEEFWSTMLLRNEFSLTKIEGELDKLDVRCANKRHVYTVEENNTWQLPKSWKNCSIYVYGAPQSSFTLVEHAQKS